MNSIRKALLKWYSIFCLERRNNAILSILKTTKIYLYNVDPSLISLVSLKWRYVPLTSFKTNFRLCVCVCITFFPFSTGATKSGSEDMGL